MHEKTLRDTIPTTLGVSLVFLFFMLSSVGSTVSWSNGGYSADPSHPDYGTHDWIAQHALDWLPDNEKQYILNNLALYLYGTELPDNNQASDGIGDTANHHVYYHSDNRLQEDNSAVRASAEFSEALTFLEAGDYADAAKTAGIMSHYIADLAAFGHVMGSGTDWGAETHHSDYESYVNDRTSSYSSTFDTYLCYDGQLSNISAYDAALQLAYNTTFGVNGSLTCVWMDNNYNWDNPVFTNRAGQSLNLVVNYLTDVLHTLYLSSILQSSNSTQQSTTAHIVINELEQNPAGTDAGNEWVELYNPTTSTVNIGGWTVSTTSGVNVTLTIPPGTSFIAKGYYVVTYGSQWLDNENESVILRDASGNEVDRTPLLSDTYNDGRSWQRYPNGLDTDTISDWSFRFSTMNSSNGGAVERSPSAISISVSPSAITIGSSIIVSGATSPTQSGVTVTLSYTVPAGTIINRTVTTTLDGRYSDNYIPSVVGSWTVSASWAGDSSYSGAISSTQTFNVLNVVLPSSITCQASKSSIVESDTITIYGSLSPALAGKVILLTYTKPDATIITRSATTLSNGSYSDVYQPDAKGSWMVNASWVGDTSYQNSSSPNVSFEVTQRSSTPGSGCVIATATYGSAMASQVQVLRDFRETIALKTFAGSSFMLVFNSWYYSWSPSVAATIAPNDSLRAAMAVVLQPILYILQVATATFSALSFNGEFAIVMTGFVAVALIGLVYFVPIFTLAFVGAKRLKRNIALPNATHSLRFTGIPWIASVALITIAELALAPMLMMIATGAYVIFTLFLIVGTVSLWLAGFYEKS
jgi:hypothetical protein